MRHLSEAMHQDHVKSTDFVMLPTVSSRLLLVDGSDSEASMIEEAILEETPSADIYRARTISEALRLLKSTFFDAAVVDHELSDGDCFDFLDFIVDIGVPLPVVVLARYGHENLAVSAMKSGASDCIRKELDHRHVEILPLRLQEAMQRSEDMHQAAERARRQEQKKLIESLRTTVASVKHEINNPLAIVSGNAQLLLELARIMELDDELVKPIRDIEEASSRIAESLDKLSNIKELIAREYTNGEESLNGMLKHRK